MSRDFNVNVLNMDFEDQVKIVIAMYKADLISREDARALLGLVPNNSPISAN